MLSEYRQRFSDFHTELHREDFLFRAGRNETAIPRISAVSIAICLEPPPSPICAQNSKLNPHTERLREEASIG